MEAVRDAPASLDAPSRAATALSCGARLALHLEAFENGISSALKLSLLSK